MAQALILYKHVVSSPFSTVLLFLNLYQFPLVFLPDDMTQTRKKKAVKAVETWETEELEQNKYCRAIA